MSDSRTRPVSIELERRDWVLVDEVLLRHGYSSLADRVRDQLPPETPTGLGAVVTARINSGATATLVLAQPGGEIPWYCPETELWHEHQEVRLVTVESPGVE